MVNNTAWFEFLLTPEILESHLQQENPGKAIIVHEFYETIACQYCYYKCIYLNE